MQSILTVTRLYVQLDASKQTHLQWLSVFDDTALCFVCTKRAEERKDFNFYFGDSNQFVVDMLKKGKRIFLRTINGGFCFWK